MDELLNSCIDLAHRAGDTVMEIYNSGDFDVQLKSDNTPLTKADLAANRIIVDGLQELSELPIVSEESSHDARGSSRFWLVDPIDGTKEFVDRNGFFTINIGLVEDGDPVLGVVYAPAKGLLYAAARGNGAFKIEQGGERQPITSKFSGQVPVVVASRSHRDERMDDFLEKLGEHTEINIGSSLKLCLVADGSASVYPRFAPTSLWDTAAADAVVREAGGSVTTPEGAPLVYTPEQTLLNPFFIARTG